MREGGREMTREARREEERTRAKRERDEQSKNETSACALVLSLTSSVCSKEAQASPLYIMFISSCASVRSREAQASRARRRALSSSPFRHDLPPSLRQKRREDSRA